jgi:hypothetical protein
MNGSSLRLKERLELSGGARAETEPVSVSTQSSVRVAPDPGDSSLRPGGGGAHQS